jgi:hypothetical protein
MNTHCPPQLAPKLLLLQEHVKNGCAKAASGSRLVQYWLLVVLSNGKKLFRWLLWHAVVAVISSGNNNNNNNNNNNQSL